MRALYLLCCFAAWLLTGCPEPSSTAETDGKTADLGSAADLACYANPTTHVEIMNACTGSQAIAKMPTLPLLGSDGTLPPLP